MSKVTNLLCFLTIYFMGCSATNPGNAIISQTRTSLNSISSSDVYNEYARGEPYELKTAISNQTLKTVAMETVRSGNKYFALLNTATDDPSESAKTIIGMPYVIARFENKPSRYPAHIFEAREIYEIVQEKTGMAELSRIKLKAIDESLEKQPDDYDLLHQKSQILIDRATYGNGDWDSVLKTAYKKLIVLEKQSDMNMFYSEASTTLFMLECLGVAKSEFTSIVGNERMSAVKNTGPALLLQSDQNMMHGSCREMGMIRK